MEKFNSTLRELLNVIKINYKEQASSIDKYYIFDENTNDKYLNEFWENTKDKTSYLSSKNEIIFSKNSIILNNIDFNKIWNDENLEETQRENIWKYLHTLWMFGYEHTLCDGKEFKSVLKNIKKMAASNLDLNDENRTLLDILDSLTHKIEKQVDSSANALDDEEGIDGSGNDGFDFKIPDLLNGVIGDLAKEIADEIDPSELDFSNINKVELMQNIMSGNFDEENDKSGVSKLVKKITNKVKDKIESGEIDQDKLKEEAMGIMKKFMGGKKGKPGKMMDAFKNMMGAQNMSEEEKEMFNQATKILESGGKMMGMKPQQMENRMKLKSTKERLLKKLADKKAKEAELTSNPTPKPQTPNTSSNNNSKQLSKSKPKK